MWDASQEYLQAAVRESYPQNYVTAAVMVFKINKGNWRRNREAVTTDRAAKSWPEQAWRELVSSSA